MRSPLRGEFDPISLLMPDLIIAPDTTETLRGGRRLRPRHRGDEVTQQPEVRPLACTRCGQQCGVAEDYESYSDWGPAVIGADGTVRPQDPEGFGHKHDPRPIRFRACCPNCGHQWTLRRRVDTDAP